MKIDARARTNSSQHWKSLKTPEEKFNEEKAELDQWLEDRKITMDQYGKLMRKAQDESIIKPEVDASSLEMGSAEAYKVLASQAAKRDERFKDAFKKDLKDQKTLPKVDREAEFYAANDGSKTAAKDRKLIDDLFGPQNWKAIEGKTPVKSREPMMPAERQIADSPIPSAGPGNQAPIGHAEVLGAIRELIQAVRESGTQVSKSVEGIELPEIVAV